jgi:hypothetical protein
VLPAGLELASQKTLTNVADNVKTYCKTKRVRIIKANKLSEKKRLARNTAVAAR